MQLNCVDSCPFPMSAGLSVRLRAMNAGPGGGRRLRGSSLRSCAAAVVVMVVASVLGMAGSACGQSTPAKSAAPGDQLSSVPLGRFVAKDKLLFYVEFDGLAAREAAWHNTAAYKMLTETPLGEMLEIVGGQLVERGLAPFANRRLNGKEVVSLLKNALISGWALAIHTGANPSETSMVFILRGATTKQIKPLASRLMGWRMGTDKFKIESKDGGRTIVAVTTAANPAAGGAAGSWAWWPEKSDLVMASPFPAAVDRVIAALDGKSPSAVDHPVVQEAQEDGRDI